MPLHRCQDCHYCRSELLPSAPSSPVLSLRFPMKKKKCIVDRGIVEIHAYPFIVVFLSFVLWRLWKQHTTTEIVPRRYSTIPQIHNNKASTFPVLFLDDLFNELPGKSEVPAFAILAANFLIDLIYIISPISHV